LDDEEAEEEALAEEAQQACSAARLAYGVLPERTAQAREAAESLPAQVAALAEEVAAAQARLASSQASTSPHPSETLALPQHAHLPRTQLSSGG
jgi:hypothetical protein